MKVYNFAPKRLYPGGPETLGDETLVGVYCGNTLPGPQMSEENSHQMKVILTTSKTGSKKGFTGFRAKYEFVEKSRDKRAYVQSFPITTDHAKGMPLYVCGHCIVGVL